MLNYKLSTFLELCETRNYTKTAENLHMTQPAVTQHIKYLEQYYGTKLFYYDEKKRIHLTEHGKSDVPCRFDVIGIEGTKITHIRDAF